MLLSKTFRRVIRIVAICYLVFLTIELGSRPFVVTSLPLETKTLFWKVISVAGHFIVMFILGFLGRLSRPVSSLRRLIGILIVYAVTMETLHLLFSNRAFEWIDMAQNVSGVLSGVFTAEGLSRWLRRFNTDSPQPETPSP